MANSVVGMFAKLENAIRLGVPTPDGHGSCSDDHRKPLLDEGVIKAQNGSVHEKSPGLAGAF
jgi:hypothetical protein